MTPRAHGPRRRSVPGGLTVLLLAAAACASGEQGPAPVPAVQAEVQVHGELRAMMHEGETGGQVSLDTLLPSSDLYAVGALAGLAGEVTILAGRAFLSYPDGESARTESVSESDAQATLLVGARVERWSSRVVERRIPFDELDGEIARLAAAGGFDPDRRLPFLIEGELEELHWHVIDGSRLEAGPSSHEAHAASAIRMQRERPVATLVGFFSSRDQGVFTHRDSRTHVHCVLDGPAAGHVDHVVVPAGALLKFPATRD